MEGVEQGAAWGGWWQDVSCAWGIGELQRCALGMASAVGCVASPPKLLGYALPLALASHCYTCWYCFIILGREVSFPELPTPWSFLD